jgi:hypothetical protein
MKRTYDPPIDHFDLAPIYREPVIRNLFRAVRRPIRHRMIEIRIHELEAEMRELRRLIYRAMDNQNDIALVQFQDREKATQLVINRLIDEDNQLAR